MYIMHQILFTILATLAYILAYTLTLVLVSAIPFYVFVKLKVMITHKKDR